MKMFKKRIILILIQTFLMSNIGFAQQVMPKSLPDALSPELIMSYASFKNIFTISDNNKKGPMHSYFKEYSDGVYIKNDVLSLKGRVIVEFGIIYHQLGNDLTPFVGGIDLIEINGVEYIESHDLKEILKMRDDLVEINSALVYMFNNPKGLEQSHVINTIMKINGIRSFLPFLIELRNTERLSKGYAKLLDAGIEAINFIVEHTDAIFSGGKKKIFNVEDLFKVEKKYGILDSQELRTPNIFGYFSGLRFIIKSLRSNVFYHAGLESSSYDVKITQDDKNIVIIYSDTGQGFNIDKLQAQAVKLGFWSKGGASIASEAEVIDLIFQKGFSLRYEKGEAHGLGLWLCRQIIENYYNGKIIARNVKNKPGAIFTIKIPLKNNKGLFSKFKSSRLWNLFKKLPSKHSPEAKVILNRRVNIHNNITIEQSL